MSGSSVEFHAITVVYNADNTKKETADAAEDEEEEEPIKNS